GPQWRRDAAALAHGHRHLLRSHPWITAVVGGRPPLLPSLFRVVEFSLATYERAGLNIGEAAQAAAAMSALVIGFAVLDEAERSAGARSGLTKEQWQQVHAPEVLAEVIPERYPALTRFVEAGDVDPDTAFATAVDQLLEGIERRTPPFRTLTQRPPRGRPTPPASG
ncbi:MAG: TetR/AcrR family transcriptional regulator C-terminal domain-containing protein, partial [Actinomycetota bacterium]